MSVTRTAEVEAQEEEFLGLNELMCFDLYSAQRAVMCAYRPLLDKLGLTYPQYLVLVALCEDGPSLVKSLCARLHLDYGTLTPLLKRLEANGLVVRRRRADDERLVGYRSPRRAWPCAGRPTTSSPAWKPRWG